MVISGHILSLNSQVSQRKIQKHIHLGQLIGWIPTILLQVKEYKDFLQPYQVKPEYGTSSYIYCHMIKSHLDLRTAPNAAVDWQTSLALFCSIYIYTSSHVFSTCCLGIKEQTLCRYVPVFYNK